MFESPCPSPFVVKSEIQLQLLGVEFQRKIANLDAVTKHKAPYVIDGEQVIEDSSFIREHFERKLGRDLDAGLTPTQRALAYGLERLLEDRLTAIMGHERWLEDDNFKRGPAQFFAAVPEAVRGQVMSNAVEGIRQWHHGQGIGRYTREERMQLAARDLSAVAWALGNQAFMFGENPTALDAIAYGTLVNCATPFFSSKLPELVRKHDTLTQYMARMRERFYAQNRWTVAA
jgi:glutathione S-transferase